MAQDLNSNMLGARREGITEAAGKLQAAGLIDYGLGHIKHSTAQVSNGGCASATAPCGGKPAVCCRAPLRAG